jgi:hypothetical protein
MPGDKKNLIFQNQRSCSKGEFIAQAKMNFSADFPWPFGHPRRMKIPPPPPLAKGGWGDLKVIF